MLTTGLCGRVRAIKLNLYNLLLIASSARMMRSSCCISLTSNTWPSLDRLLFPADVVPCRRRAVNGALIRRVARHKVDY